MPFLGDRRVSLGRLPAIAAAAAALFVTAPAATAAVTLAGQWRFDETAGQTAVDDGPSGLDGVLGARPAVDAADPLRVGGPSSGALRFDGASYVTVADRGHLDLQALTVTAVARAVASPGVDRYLVAHGSWGCFTGAYGLYTAANGGLAFYVFDGERYFVSPSASPSDVWDGAWHQVTGTFDGDHVRAYVDGRQIGAGFATPPGSAIEYASTNGGTVLGSYLGACELPFVGDLDAVQIWSGVGPPSATTGTAPPASVAGGSSIAAGRPGAAVKATPSGVTCTVRVSRRRIVTRRRQTLTLRVVDASRPSGRVRLTVTWAGAHRLLYAPRTDRRGRARLVVKMRRAGRLRIGVRGRPRCAPAFVRVTHAR